MSEESSEPPGRRRFLFAAAAAGAATLAGCTAVWDQTGATDAIVRNATPEPKTVSVTITPDGAEEPHTSRTLDLPARGVVDPVNRSKLPTNDAYTVAVDVDGGPSETFEWTDPRVELAPLHVLIDGTGNVKFLLQAG